VVGLWAVVSVAGLCLGERVAEAKRAALFAMAACGGAIVTELLDLHLMRLHLSADVPATIVLHAPSFALGIAAAGLMILGPGLGRRGRRSRRIPRTDSLAGRP